MIGRDVGGISRAASFAGAALAICCASSSARSPVDAAASDGWLVDGTPAGRGETGAAGAQSAATGGTGAGGTGGEPPIGGRTGAGGVGWGGAGGRATPVEDAGEVRGDSGGTERDGGGWDGGTDAATPEVRCTLILGNSTTQQWFDGGFLTYPGIVAARWELIAVAHHYVGDWAAPNDAAWTAPFDSGHACTQGAQTPDRVIFIVTQSPPYPSESTYETQTTAVVKNIRAKYPGARQIALTTLVRSPGNEPAACSSQPNNEQSIPAAEDQAIAAVAASPAFAGFVVALPPFYVSRCANFVDDHPQYTPAGAAEIAKEYGAYFAVAR